MTGIDWAALSRLAPELTLVVIFCAFVLASLRLLIWWLDRREVAQSNKDARRDKTFLDAIDKQSADWRSFMDVERVRQAEGMSKLAHEMVNLAALVRDTNGLIVQHDAWERRELEIRMPVKPATGPLTPHTP